MPVWLVMRPTRLPRTAGGRSERNTSMPGLTPAVGAPVSAASKQSANASVLVMSLYGSKPRRKILTRRRVRRETSQTPLRLRSRRRTHIGPAAPRSPPQRAESAQRGPRLGRKNAFPPIARRWPRPIHFSNCELTQRAGRVAPTARRGSAGVRSPSHFSAPTRSFAKETMRSRPFHSRKTPRRPTTARASLNGRAGVLRTVSRSGVFPACGAVSAANGRGGAAQTDSSGARG